MTSQLLQSLISLIIPPAQPRLVTARDYLALISALQQSTLYTPVPRPLGDTFTVCVTAGGVEIKLNKYPLEDLWKGFVQ